VQVSGSIVNLHPTPSGKPADHTDDPEVASLRLDAQEHSGHNIGINDTMTLFVELKEPAPAASRAARLAPST
jgi:hypothetical protein